MSNPLGWHCTGKLAGRGGGGWLLPICEWSCTISLGFFFLLQHVKTPQPPAHRAWCPYPVQEGCVCGVHRCFVHAVQAQASMDG